jgi:UrcA family protein
MTKLTARIAGLAIIAVSVASVAQAAPASIRVADLNLATTRGVTTYNKRVDRIAYQMCSEGYGARLRNTACEQAVKAEAGEKLAAIQQTTQFAKR